MTPPSRRRLDPTGKSGVRIVFSRCRRHHAAEPARFNIKNELVPQRGEHDMAKTQYICHFRLLIDNALAGPKKYPKSLT